MIRILAKKEREEHLKRLLEFCKENQTLMWNFMIIVKNIRNEMKTKLNKIKNELDEYDDIVTSSTLLKGGIFRWI